MKLLLRNNVKKVMGLDKDNVFAQRLKFPECVKLLLNCLQNLETEMKM